MESRYIANAFRHKLPQSNASTGRCHTGKTILYDTVTKLNWAADIRTHRIGVIIDQLLDHDWEEGKPVPEAVPEDDCIVSLRCDFHGEGEALMDVVRTVTPGSMGTSGTLLSGWLYELHAAAIDTFMRKGRVKAGPSKACQKPTPSAQRSRSLLAA